MRRTVGNTTNSDVAIVGGGLVGSLLSVFLVRRGLSVTVYERRPDMRGGRQEAGRSINLVLTSRGIHALGLVGLKHLADELTVAVHGRMMHSAEGALIYQPYGRDISECNHSISRAALNQRLVTAAEERGVRFCFERRLVDADFDGGKLTFAGADGEIVEEVGATRVFGADGGGSAVRRLLQRMDGFTESIEPLGHGYKELTIPAGPAGEFRIEKNALHIWPRGRLMLMALPNLDGSFTVTLYLPESGASSFEELRDAACVQQLFDEQFTDSVPLIPDLAQRFLEGPTGDLATVRCRPWHYRDRVMLIGDAAHAVVPFFGQGMNCGFEDCSVLDGLMEQHGDDWAKMLIEFDHARKPNTDAIADMALENFVEMRDHVGDAGFRLRKQVEHRLEREWPGEYRSRYSMVMYSDVPYRVAREVGVIQQQILDRLCAGLSGVDTLDLPAARQLIKDRLTPFLREHAVDLSY